MNKLRSTHLYQHTIFKIQHKYAAKYNHTHKYIYKIKNIQANRQQTNTLIQIQIHTQTHISTVTHKKIILQSQTNKIISNKHKLTLKHSIIKKN